MAEGLNAGAGGVVPKQEWIHFLTVPLGKRFLIRFEFHADYENEIWVCSVDTGNVLIKRGNYHHGSGDWVSENNNSGQDTQLAIVAYHKNSSPHGSKPWFQSPMKVRVRSKDGRQVVVGFDDAGAQNFNNAVAFATMLD